MTSQFNESKKELWTSAEKWVRFHLDAMPEQHRARLKEIAEAEFPEIVTEIKEMKEKFKVGNDIPSCRYASERYVTLNRELFRKVSLFMLGVKK